MYYYFSLQRYLTEFRTLLKTKLANGNVCRRFSLFHASVPHTKIKIGILQL